MREQQEQIDLLDIEETGGVDMNNTHEAVSRAWSHFVSLLDDVDFDVRQESAHLLAYLPQHVDNSIRELEQRLPSSESAKPSFLLALAILGRQASIAVDIGPQPTANESVPTRIAWWCARSLLGTECADELLALIGLPELPAIGSWLDGESLTILLQSLSVHSNWLTESRLPPIEQQLQNVSPFVAANLATVLLHEVAFPKPLPENIDELDSLGQAVLGVLHRSNAWMINGGTNGNWSGAMESFFVPSEQERLERYLTGDSLSDCLFPHVRERIIHARAAFQP
jgi:hypothetical protein